MLNQQIVETYQNQPLWVKLWTIKRLEEENDFDTLEWIREQENLCACGNDRLAELDVCEECL